MIGALCIGLYASKSVNPDGPDGYFFGDPSQLWKQAALPSLSDGTNASDACATRLYKRLIASLLRFLVCQAVGVLAAMVWSALGTWAIFTFMHHEGLRVRGSAEELGVCLLVCSCVYMYCVQPLHERLAPLAITEH